MKKTIKPKVLRKDLPTISQDLLLQIKGGNSPSGRIKIKNSTATN